MDVHANGATLLAVAYWVAVLTLLLAFSLLTIIVILRARSQWRERRDKRAQQHWLQVMRQVLAGKEVQLRLLGKDEVTGFIEVWNTTHESLSQADSARLLPLGHRVGLVDAARRMLRGNYHDCAMAIIALGHLRDRSVFDELVPFLNDHSPIVSLCAAHALGQVDPPQAMAMFVPMILERDDWMPGNVARILARNEDGSAVRELDNTLLRASTSSMVKLVRFLADIDPDRAAVVIRQLLDGSIDDHAISVCLQLVNDRQDRERVAGFLDAPRWHVRMHAASALGRIGEAADSQRLEPMLADKVWWVRYRAAQALLALPGMGAAAMREMQHRQGDAYGRDIIDQVLSEHDMGVVA
ncbi:HEAT repeat domain-containing protein [Rhodanobacter sp. DHB23]|uniref:HEAT repeat domain-containing protein n=1 Tax=Rhodanobacter sp. DHB23 TaxID=2775923 RepID=UPI001785C964|nr:HEAT repeat domain-containing protein [Rhodanobacter sp. DHB23]MBD8874420.1 HEAT repeat domain-containing protein [Rhodanobacter sp. DHB23]